MAVDTNKLAALVEEQNQNPMASMPEVAGEEEMPEDEMGEETAAVDGEAILEEMGEFGVMLKESADVIVPIAEEIGEDLAGDSEYQPETEDAVVEAVDRMPEEIVEGLAENLAERSPEELTAVGEVLAKEVDTMASPAGEVEPVEAEQVGGLLEVAAKVAGEDALPEDDLEEEPAEEFEPEEGAIDEELPPV